MWNHMDVSAQEFCVIVCRPWFKTIVSELFAENKPGIVAKPLTFSATNCFYPRKLFGHDIPTLGPHGFPLRNRRTPFETKAVGDELWHIKLRHGSSRVTMTMLVISVGERLILQVWIGPWHATSDKNTTYGSNFLWLVDKMSKKILNSKMIEPKIGWSMMVQQQNNGTLWDSPLLISFDEISEWVASSQGFSNSPNSRCSTASDLAQVFFSVSDV